MSWMGAKSPIGNADAGRYGDATFVSLADATRVKNSKYRWPTFGQNMGFA